MVHDFISSFNGSRMRKFTSLTNWHCNAKCMPSTLIVGSWGGLHELPGFMIPYIGSIVEQYYKRSGAKPRKDCYALEASSFRHDIHTDDFVRSRYHERIQWWPRSRKKISARVLGLRPPYPACAIVASVSASTRG